MNINPFTRLWVLAVYRPLKPLVLWLERHLP